VRAGDAALLFLSAASGATDVVAFLLLGHVFTSAMTGNTALLGVALGLRDGPAAARSAFALLGFLAGVVAGCAASRKEAASVRGLLLFELVVVAAFALAWPALSDKGNAAIYSLIFVSSLGMGVQGIAATEASRKGTTTIVFTSVLLRIAEAATRLLLRHPVPREERVRARRQAGGYAAYIAAAVLAALALSSRPSLAVWLPVMAVTAAALLNERELVTGRRGQPA
jgi:uncharacterized membrane protein YoaK (UPF0700 family)